MADILEIAICTTEKIRASKIAEEVKNQFWGYGIKTSIREFTSSEKCLSELELHPAKLVFLGIETEDMDGIQLGEEILFANINRRPEIIYVSSHTERVFDTFAVRPFAFVREQDFQNDIQELAGRYVQEKMYLQSGWKVKKMPVKKTFWEYLNEYAAVSPEKVLLMDEKKKLTVREVKEFITGLAEGIGQKGIQTGDYVALRASLSMETILLFWALQIIGARTVLTDSHENVEDFLQKNGAGIPVKAMLTDEEKKGEWILKKAEENWKIQAAEGFQEKRLLMDCKSPTIIIFTSGSTGRSKAVMLSQYNFANNLEDTRNIGGYIKDDRALGFLPLNHVFGLALLTGALVLQHTFVIASGIQPEQLLQSIEKYRITRMNGIPEIFMRMAEKADQYNLCSLHAGLIGGSPSTKQQFARIEEKLGIVLVPVYGMSECIGISCGNYADSQEIRMRGVGRFYSMNDGKIQREDGSFARQGEEGEILIKSPAQMCGYLNSLEDHVDDGGYLHTGDLGYVDEQMILHISGRKKDIIIRNGVNISARKIEEKLLEIDGICEAAVVGVTSAEYGEVPIAVIVSHTEAIVPEEIKEELQKNKMLTSAEIPERIFLAEKLPKTSSGKTDKEKIRVDYFNRR